MDRIRKKLGEDVPAHLVFPDNEETDTTSVDSMSMISTAPAVTIHWRPLPPLPSETDTSSISSHSVPTTRTRLSTARDSLLIQSSFRTHRIKRKPVPKFDQEDEAKLCLPLPDTESLRRREKERLSLILELPHELEDYSDSVLSTPETDGSSPTSIWFGDEGEDDLRVYRDCYRQFLHYNRDL
ncbi:hypothetical protein EV360DRAFT_45740 [Lentinula raphanica]|nr:hypothetical protein EV360DRAFT_45740 [Lentinula raphanica]